MMKITISEIPKKISKKIELGVNSVTRICNKIGVWRSIPLIVVGVAVICSPLGFIIGSEAGAVILFSSSSIALAGLLTNRLIYLVDNERKKRYENILGNLYCINLTQGKKNDILAASMSADFSGDTRVSQSIPATGLDRKQEVIFTLLK